MARKREQQPGNRTAAYRNLLRREDLTLKMARRKITLGLVAAGAGLALVGWLLVHFAAPA